MVHQTKQFQAPDFGRFLKHHMALFFLPTCVMDAEGRIVWWNIHAETVTGIPSSKMLGLREGYRLFGYQGMPELIQYVMATGTVPSEATCRAQLLYKKENALAISVAGEDGTFLLLHGSYEDQETGSVFVYYAWSSFSTFDFDRSPSLDLFHLLSSLDRNGDVWLGVCQKEVAVYVSRPLIEKLYAPRLKTEELLGVPITMSMDDATASDHKRTINSLSEGNTHPILHWPHRRGDEKVWTQAWPNIIRVNGTPTNFSLVRDITAEKEQDSLLEGIFTSQRKEHLPAVQAMMTMFAGHAKAMIQPIELLLRASLSLVTVSIYGETGTGKSQAARLVHNLSSKADGSFVSVNCGAIPDELFESNFFGHVKGAFTGAIRDTDGLLTKADNGTLFLDEIAELSPRAQSKLLQALSDKSYTPVGSTKELHSNFRLIVATNRDLKQMVREGTFREDLYYRVNVLDVTLPPLRERKEDLPLIVNNILQRNNLSVSPPSSFYETLAKHSWPGNIRELENVVLRYTAENTLDFFTPVGIPNASGEEDQSCSQNEPLSLREQVAATEKNAIRNALYQHCWNRQKTAEALGITRITLFRKMKEYGIISH